MIYGYSGFRLLCKNIDINVRIANLMIWIRWIWIRTSQRFTL